MTHAIKVGDTVRTVRPVTIQDGFGNDIYAITSKERLSVVSIGENSVHVHSVSGISTWLPARLLEIVRESVSPSDVSLLLYNESI